MRNLRRILTLLLALTLTLSLAAPGLASDDGSAAEALHVLGLFKGTDKGFELEKDMTRLEALIMTIRLTGNEWNALYGEWSHPFTDVPAWEGAAEYVGYAYEKGLVTGVTPTALAPDEPASARMFMTLLLRALGYRDGDRTVWDNWAGLAEQAGLPVPDNSAPFLRGEMTQICWAALNAQVQDTDKTLDEMLQENGVYSDLAMTVAQVMMGKTVTVESSLTDIAGAIYAGVDSAMTPSVLAVNEISGDNMSYFLGTDRLNVAEGIAIEPMFTARAHSVCLVRMKNERDVESAKTAILENVNPNKWICVGVDPENIRIASIGSLICLVMDNGNPDGLMNSFMSLGKAQPDESGMILVGKNYVEAGRETNADYISRFAQKLISIRSAYIPHNQVYYAVVPDKTYYMKDSVSLGFDHAAITELLAQNLPGWTEIDLTDLLSVADYYNTDPHWRQEALLPVVQRLAETMDFEAAGNFTVNERAGFVGSYGRKVENLEGETLRWLTSAATEKAVVENIQHPDVTAVYDAARLDTNNPYDFFLSGATPLQVIKNSDAKTDRELVIFRDSYGSSLAPLLIESYAKITLVDLRYMASALIPQYVELKNADVLFLYSDALVNNLLLLK